MKIEINNSQTLYRTDKRKIIELVRHFLQCAQHLCPQCHWRGISVALVDDERISWLNQEHLGHHGATDVISFSYAHIPGEAVGETADIIVNVQRAWQTVENPGGPGRLPRGWSVSHELALYLAHGCDHLAGQNDATPQARRRMRARELRWVHKADALHMIEGVVRGR